MGHRKQIKRLLIVNRGEIAVRIIKTCKLMGIETVVAVTPPDVGSLFSFEATFCHTLDSSILSETYLNGKLMVELCSQYNCDAVHPGYGFLSENADFARLCKKNDIIFIGPDAETIDLMGNKIVARQTIEKLGIPLLKGIADNDEKKLIQNAAKLKFPLLIKAAAGGGGRGMRIVERKEDLKRELDSARNEALNAFGDGTVYIERYLTDCRHIEVQVISDSQGNHLHLLERECSIQRRHQKVIEECPSSTLTFIERERICQAALKITKGVNYLNAGTVEFLWSDGEFYFLEMNTRLQVEHPVTEAVTGLDLVKLQIETASGKELSIKQENITVRGHAIEARIYAEDPEKGFLPAVGTVIHTGTCDFDHVRVETSFMNGNKVPIEYDSMLAKVSAWDTNRLAAAHKLKNALKSLPFQGVKNNRDFLLKVIEDEDFLKGDTFTNFIEKHEFSFETADIPAEIIAAAFLIHVNSSDSEVNDNPWMSS
jgi:3-methylcrotonyl-CoA carboxylase alpha subunit